MKKLYLSSLKLDHLDQLLSDKPENLKLAFIPTAGDPYDNPYFVDSDRKTLTEMGFNLVEVDLKKYNQQSLLKELKNVDVIHVAGGNTFYLLQKVRESGFDKIINQLLDDGKVYIGVSAGAVLVGPDIETALPWDENDVGLEDTTGLNIIPFSVLPHHKKEDDEIIEKLKKKVNYEIKSISDEQAFLINDKVVKLV